MNIVEREEYYIRPIEKKDRYLLKKWGVFEDPIYEGYNYAKLTDTELAFWYGSKQFPFRSSYFSILKSEDQMIGYVGIKEINRFLKSSKLGIVLNPDFVSKGYGSIILEDFLNYYFGNYGMKRIILEVNDWNVRARKLYEKMGFKYVLSNLQKFENQQLDIDKKKYDHLRNSFKEVGDVLYSKVWKMTLSKKEFEERNENKATKK